METAKGSTACLVPSLIIDKEADPQAGAPSDQVLHLRVSDLHQCSVSCQEAGSLWPDLEAMIQTDTPRADVFLFVFF